MFKLARAGLSKSNATRNLTILMQGSGVMLPVKSDCIQITIKRKRRQNRLEKIWFPILRMSAWIECLLRECPPLLLAGHNLEDRTGWENTFYSFWENYQLIDPSHPIYSSTIPWGRAIPWLLHGDEGRGLRRVPYMVEAWLLLVSHRGITETNESSKLC